MASPPYGWSVYAAGAIGAVPDRDVYTVECHEDIEALYDDGLTVDPKGQSWIACGYCGDQKRTTRKAAHRWFRSHECDIDQERAARNQELRRAWAATAWDLGISLPAGHPFAPAVDNEQAA